jgi:hypothetical protein
VDLTPVSITVCVLRHTFIGNFVSICVLRHTFIGNFVSLLMRPNLAVRREADEDWGANDGRHDANQPAFDVPLCSR